jgi:hypothetical protein
MRLRSIASCSISASSLSCSAFNSIALFLSANTVGVELGCAGVGPVDIVDDAFESVDSDFAIGATTAGAFGTGAFRTPAANRSMLLDLLVLVTGFSGSLDAGSFDGGAKFSARALALGGPLLNKLIWARNGCFAIDRENPGLWKDSEVCRMYTISASIARWLIEGMFLEVIAQLFSSVLLCPRSADAVLLTQCKPRKGSSKL